MEKQCHTIAHNTVCVEAQVKIIPEVQVGKALVKCKGAPFIGCCPGPLKEICSFSVSQRIYVLIPLSFDACVSAIPAGIACGEPKTGIWKDDADLDELSEEFE